jgi:hypothetical protein
MPAGQPLHDIWVRLTVDGEFVVRAIEAASDVTPWSICKEAEGTLQVLVGEKLARGWSAKVKERLRGAASCTHLMEMLIPLATTGCRASAALQLERYMNVEGDDGPAEDRQLLRVWPQPRGGAETLADALPAAGATCNRAFSSS